ncbi:MAG: M23 family metallopeptidase [Candidatus Sumerlaeaceae bacterium]|nr:M23 family metallopeptidase [Candidatus Sumerlaeaceae bacterium]
MRKHTARLLASVALLSASVASSSTSRPPAPSDLNVRIVGTASFQGRQTALIEDSNTRSDSFYRVGDPIYGYKITEISSDGISLEKRGQKYFVAFQATSVRARATEEKQKVVVANTYLPSQSSASTIPNFYLDAPKSTDWDKWTANAAIKRPRTVATVASLPAPANAAETVKVEQSPNAGGRFIFPLASYKKLTSNFGYRVHPIGGNTKMHKGIDLSSRPGTKIFAGDAGTVRFAGWKGGYGYCVIIDHHNGYSTLYGHCSKLIADAGDNVKRGEYIAEVGSTGASTGPHLHFEVHKGETPIDPLPFFRGIL